MYDLLNGMRVVELASFIAAPSCALHLSQMGAEVIRIDQVGGGPDFGQWPLSPGSGASLYWHADQVLGMSGGEIARSHDQGIAA